jgi:hypothetical protein
VQDIAWDQLKRRGTIQFAPAFDKLTVSSTYPAPSDAPKGTDTTFFTVSGFDFKRTDLTQNCNDKKKSYCLRMYIGNEQKPGLLQEATDNAATFLVSSGALGKAKAIRFQLADMAYRPKTDVPWNDLTTDPEIVEWDVPIPKADDTSKVSVNPTYMYKGDSQTATVTGGGINFSYLKDVLYDNKVYYTPPAGKKPAADKLELLISTDVTKTSGRKEFVIELVDDKGNASTQKFVIDVTLR